MSGLRGGEQRSARGNVEASHRAIHSWAPSARGCLPKKGRSRSTMMNTRRWLKGVRRRAKFSTFHSLFVFFRQAGWRQRAWRHVRRPHAHSQRSAPTPRPAFLLRLTAILATTQLRRSRFSSPPGFLGGGIRSGGEGGRVGRVGRRTGRRGAHQRCQPKAARSAGHQHYPNPRQALPALNRKRVCKPLQTVLRVPPKLRH